MSKLTFPVAKSRARFLLLFLALGIVALFCISPYFSSLGNLLQITQSGVGLILLLLGEALIMVGGKNGTGVSIGSIMNLSGVIFGLAVTGRASISVAIVTSLATGAAPSVVSGVLIAIAGMPALIAALDTQYVYNPLALYLADGIPVSGFPESFEWLSLEDTFGIPNQVLFVVIPVTMLVFILIYKAKFGWHAYLMGTNLEVARFTGIHEVRIRMGICISVGVLAAISAVINNSWLMMARADADTGVEMQTITVIVLGGTNVAGGSGHLDGALIGTIIITVMSSGLRIANVNSVWQLAALGLILVLAIVLNHMMNKFVIRVGKNRE